MEIVHSWLKDYLGDNTPSIDEMDGVLTHHSFEVEEILEREGENIVDLDILPNRSSDSMSHRGVAREIASLLDVSLENDPLIEEVSIPETEKISIRIADHEACPRFTASLITGIEVKDSPEWLQTRLKALGQRPINNIVDATNYVMFALGQPMHAYDADKFPNEEGDWKFGVRFAEEGETVSLLPEGGVDEDRIVELVGTELLIVDESTNTPVGLAGIKGGRYAEVDSGTKNIIVEAAHFHPTIVRKTGRRLGILTDASRRFENEPSRNLPTYAQSEIVDLITKIAGGECEGMADKFLVKQEPVQVAVRVQKTNGLLGTDLSKAEIRELILRTGAKLIDEDEQKLVFEAPWERNDLNIEEDYIEEVGRIHGLAEIESVKPEPMDTVKVNPRQYYSEKVRRVLVDQGFSEVITTSFQKKGKVQLRNALASDKSYLRNSLVKNITAVLDANYVHNSLLGVDDVRVFEIGTVFSKDDSGVNEKVVLAIGARTKGDGFNPKDDKILALGANALKEALGIDLEWRTEKGVAELDLLDIIEGLPKPDKYEETEKLKDTTFKSIIPYPAIARDIALWVDGGETAEAVMETLTNEAGDLCVRQTLFDTFSKDDRTSYAFRLVFQSPEKTLTDEEVNVVMDKINQVAEGKGWQVR